MGKMHVSLVSPRQTSIYVKSYLGSRYMKHEVSIGQKKCQLEINPMHHYKENELNSDHMISLFADNYPGNSVDECMAMVYKPQPKMAKHASQSQWAGFSESKSIFWCHPVCPPFYDHLYTYFSYGDL